MKIHELLAQYRLSESQMNELGIMSKIGSGIASAAKGLAKGAGYAASVPGALATQFMAGRDAAKRSFTPQNRYNYDTGTATADPEDLVAAVNSLPADKKSAVVKQLSGTAPSSMSQTPTSVSHKARADNPNAVPNKPATPDSTVSMSPEQQRLQKQAAAAKAAQASMVPAPPKVATAQDTDKPGPGSSAFGSMASTLNAPLKPSTTTPVTPLSPEQQRLQKQAAATKLAQTQLAKTATPPASRSNIAQPPSPTVAPRKAQTAALTSTPPSISAPPTTAKSVRGPGGRFVKKTAESTEVYSKFLGRNI